MSEQRIKLTEAESEELIRRVDGAMAQEGMPLTTDDKETLKRINRGLSTFEIERNRIINEHRRLYG